VLLSQHILTSSLECLPDRFRSLSQVPNAFSNHHLVFRSDVLLLEGLSENFGNLLSRSSCVNSKNKLRVLQNELSQVLVLKLSFFDIVSDGEDIDPIVR